MAVKELILFILLLMILLTICFRLKPRHIPNQPITIDDVWVINLDSAVDRWENIKKQTGHIQWKVHRWPATLGKAVRKNEAHVEGVCQIMTLKTDTKKDAYMLKTTIENNHGKVGCWLSHKRLLTYLSNLDMPDHHAHLIVEDDISFHNGFLDEWPALAQKIPADWDMIYVGITNPNLKNPVEPPVYRGTTLHTTQGNWGTHAYIVKQGSIRSRILPKLKYMSHEIDVQMNMYFDEMNVYVVYPNFLKLDSHYSKISSIELPEQ